MGMPGVAATLAGVVLLLSGCGTAAADVAKKCGGEANGLYAERDGTLGYVGLYDQSGDAWTCALNETVDNTTAYRIALSLDDGEPGSIEANGYTIEWATGGPMGILLSVSR